MLQKVLGKKFRDRLVHLPGIPALFSSSGAHQLVQMISSSHHQASPSRSHEMCCVDSTNAIGEVIRLVASCWSVSELPWRVRRARVARVLHQANTHVHHWYRHGNTRQTL